MTDFSYILSSISGSDSGSVKMQQLAISWIDIVVTAAYLIGVVFLGCWVGIRHKKKGGQAQDYFLASKTLGDEHSKESQLSIEF